jgi:hypothetical protein
MPSEYHLRREALAPRRAIAAAVSLVSFFILAALAIAQFGSSQSSSKLALRIENSARSGDAFLAKSRAAAAGDKYLIGVGKADATGPVVEINFAGYASDSASTRGPLSLAKSTIRKSALFILSSIRSREILRFEMAFWRGSPLLVPDILCTGSLMLL